MGVAAVDRTSALGQLQGSDNIMEVHTNVYASPLVVQGSGAGDRVTAMGVLADMVALVQ